ncbi:MAG: hypothetical protein PHF84_03775 [bacterium]|nr:hypothetical protein [bacterium]
MKNKNNRHAWVISVIMGLGHMRAAYPLRDLAYEDIIIAGRQHTSTPEEFKTWKRLLYMYYFISKAEKIPLIGKFLFGFLNTLENILPYYPKRNLSKPNWAVLYLNNMVVRKGLCSTIINRIASKKMPVVNTYFATAIAIDKLKPEIKENYLVVTDTDINRVWVPDKPEKSRIKYLTPCTSAKERLMAYGVPEKDIYMTGFPLPKENIGSEKNMEILKNDLFSRLVRLDPEHKFFSFHKNSILKLLGKKEIPVPKDDIFTLTFAVGGAGAQTELAKQILRSLKDKLIQKKIRINLALGILLDVYNDFINYIHELKIIPHFNNELKIIHNTDIYKYFDQFNQALHTTDVLWTKPSEMSFYCGPGIPILIAPPIGVHEELNKKWLQEIHAGLEAAGPVEYTNEWLFDLRAKGRLAESAWDGFLKARKLGTYKIEKLVLTGKFKPDSSPLKQ